MTGTQRLLQMVDERLAARLARLEYDLIWSAALIGALDILYMVVT